jgi:carbon-monoxide dehydrogenase large subunit
VPFDDVYVDESDTDIVKEGGGSHSARSMRLAGIVMGKASDAIIEKSKRIAAHMLETAEDDIGFAAGRFTVKGTDRSARSRSGALHRGRRRRARAVNPMIVEGQTHGGAAQGIGQALCELCAYDPQGQLLSASFMDYAVPRADMLPSFTTDISEVLTPTNSLGVRGAGEGGTTGALGAVVNAVVDALAEFGVTHIEMPVTPERVWRAIQSSKM